MRWISDSNVNCVRSLHHFASQIIINITDSEVQCGVSDPQTALIFLSIHFRLVRTFSNLWHVQIKEIFNYLKMVSCVSIKWSIMTAHRTYRTASPFPPPPSLYAAVCNTTLNGIRASQNHHVHTTFFAHHAPISKIEMNSASMNENNWGQHKAISPWIAISNTRVNHGILPDQIFLLWITGCRVIPI